MVRSVVAFACGVGFALGLGLGGMTQPSRVLAFLDVSGDWDPRLAFVMCGAIAVYAPIYRLALRRAVPLCAPAFDLPTRRSIDTRLVVGALLFGIGWGLAGLCPGPALTSLASGEPAAVLFVAAMLAGLGLARQRRTAAAPVAVAGRQTETA
ncbi:MAG: YeeE/YedE family protein [Deltaproteobacteria bacterium]|nr:YeeE/YedE family protein [Deltaproteobacteria bacterium]